MDILKQFSAIETADGYHYAGTSNDVKPTDCMNGSIFKETDTGKFYIFDASAGTWAQVLLAGGGEPAPEPVYGSLTAIENGTYDPADYNYDAFDEVTVNVPSSGADAPYLEVTGLPNSFSVPEGYPMDAGLFTTLPTVTLVYGNTRKTLTYSVSIPDYKSLEEVTHWNFEVPVRHKSSLPNEFVAIPCVRIVGGSGYTCLFSDKRMSVNYIQQNVTFRVMNFAPPYVLNSPYKATNVKCYFKSTGFDEISYSLRNICGIRVEFRTTSQSSSSNPYKVKLITDTNSNIIDADDFLEGETQLVVKAGMILYEHSIADVIAYLDVTASYTTETTVTKGDI